MKTELELVKQQHVALNLPVRDEPPKLGPAAELIARRRMIRVETDDFLKKGLWSDDLVMFSIHLGRVAFVVASTLVQFGVKPEIVDFADALQTLIETTRQKIDKALAVSDWSALKKAAVELEIIWYGAAANIGLPYTDLLQILHDAYVENRDLDFPAIHSLLIRAGLPVKPYPAPAANEP